MAIVSIQCVLFQYNAYCFNTMHIVSMDIVSIHNAVTVDIDSLSRKTLLFCIGNCMSIQSVETFFFFPVGNVLC